MDVTTHWEMSDFVDYDNLVVFYSFVFYHKNYYPRTLHTSQWEDNIVLCCISSNNILTFRKWTG